MLAREYANAERLQYRSADTAKLNDAVCQTLPTYIVCILSSGKTGSGRSTLAAKVTSMSSYHEWSCLTPLKTFNLNYLCTIVSNYATLLYIHLNFIYSRLLALLISLNSCSVLYVVELAKGMTTCDELKCV